MKPPLQTTSLRLSVQFAFTTSRMRKVSGYIKELPSEFKSQHKHIIVDDEDDQLCWYRFLACCLYPELTNPKSDAESNAESKRVYYGITNRTKRAIKLLLEERGITYTTKMPEQGKQILKAYQGITMEEMKESAKKYKINIDIYEYHHKQSSNESHEQKYYDLQEQWYFSKDYPIHSALLFTQEMVIHIMYIKDIEKLTAIHICPKCHSYLHHGHQNIYRFNDHVAHCYGKFKQLVSSAYRQHQLPHIPKQFVPVKEALPYCPHILNNPEYEYCLAHDIEWKPTIYYMTYDF